MDQKKIDRINALYHKSKAEGLTEAEKKEQALLRKEYIASVRSNLKAQLNNIDVKEADGSIVNLGKKYGNKSSKLEKHCYKNGKNFPKTCARNCQPYKWAVNNLGRTAKQGIFLRVLSVGNRIVSASSDTMAVRYRQTCRTT